MAKTNKPRLLQFYFPSATNHQSVKRLQAVWLIGNEIGFTLERTQRTELLFLIGSQARCSSHQWGPTCRYCGSVSEGQERKERGVRLRGDLEKGMQAFLVRRGERAFWYTCQTHEQSTSVHPLLLRQMSQSKNRAFWKHSTLISASLCHTVSLFFHTNMSAHTHTYTDKEEEMQMGLEQKCHNANTACKIQHQHYRF